MLDVFEFCMSSVFLAGGAVDREKHYEFPLKKPWIRRVTHVREYVDAVTRDPHDETQETPWHVFEEMYLNDLNGIVTKVTFNGCGPFLEEKDRMESTFSEHFGAVQQTRQLALEIGRIAQIDGERLYGEALMETPYGHLNIIMWMQELFPKVEFPLITVMVDAYEEGLLPYGVFNGRLDFNYAGPDVLLCIDPANLELKD